jgi:hypothetical protein
MRLHERARTFLQPKLDQLLRIVSLPYHANIQSLAVMSAPHTH